jgi:hypothetical protein
VLELRLPRARLRIHQEGIELVVAQHALPGLLLTGGVKSTTGEASTSRLCTPNLYI